MNPRKIRNRSTISTVRFSNYAIIGILVCIGIVVLILIQQPVQAPEKLEETKAEEAKPKKVWVDFHMADLTHGWIQLDDGMMMTEDGGVTWKGAAPGTELPLTTDEALKDLLSADHSLKLTSITIQSKAYEVKKSQFLTDRIGWALLADGEQIQSRLWVTGDGGFTWQDQVTPELQSIAAAELRELQRITAEASYYPDRAAARQVMQPDWTLLPQLTAPGDIVLVRHKEPGQVIWQGKTYVLQPFGAGYFSYIPMSMDIKPGRYPIGDQWLTVQEKKFETQYLTVSKQLEGMKQDTARINADQHKIDKARSVSQPEFLFTKPFIQPVEGILTTPYGFTRYVNGKYDSSHRAVDLAAKEGTPIHAANDGVVVLAESLYLTGNSIYIDHGMHLFSQYAHLSELRVKTGDRVKQGDIIGLVGTTGFSTGPHLHFTFWAHNVPVNPNLFFGTTPFHWMKPKS